MGYPPVNHDLPSCGPYSTGSLTNGPWTLSTRAGKSLTGLLTILYKAVVQGKCYCDVETFEARLGP